MRFTWNPAKAASNLAKHGVAFEAVLEFEFETALIRATLAHEGGEPRLLAHGGINGRLYALVYTIDRGTTHVISLRKSNNREKADYASS